MQKPKVGFVSLGCPKNQVDTEVMLGLLDVAGFELTAEDIEKIYALTKLSVRLPKKVKKETSVVLEEKNAEKEKEDECR